MIDDPQIETQALIEACLQGDQTAYAALYDRFAAGIYRLCYGLLLNREDAEDIAQEAFVYAFKNLRRYDASKSAFKTWLYTIAISRCRNVYRRQRLPSVDLFALLQQGIPAPRNESPEAAYARTSAAEAVTQALRSLSPRLREAIVLRYAKGLTYREMSEVIGCPPKTAESRVRLAHEALRGLLQPQGALLFEELLHWA